jgi:tetratricopeptide (TPR) repeat protein
VTQAAAATIASAQASKSQEVAPYDITINASELARPESENLETTGEENIPHIVISPQGDARQHPLPPVLEITVDEDNITPITPRHHQAAATASEAKALARQGDIQRALRLQHRAVELEPDNMLYRLDLAVLYDRAGEKSGAIGLYRQVVNAYDSDDESLPEDFKIDDIRQRLAYLVSTGL